MCYDWDNWQRLNPMAEDAVEPDRVERPGLRVLEERDTKFTKYAKSIPYPHPIAIREIRSIRSDLSHSSLQKAGCTFQA